jgi:predicted RNase H-like HicB family nuclease
MTTYTARAIRSGDWWAIEIEELDGVYSQARRLDRVERMARDAIALTLDVAPDRFDVAVLPELSDEAQGHVDGMRQAKAAADVIASLAAVRTHSTIVYLHEDQGMPLRDIGRVLGISYQRVHQLLSAPAGFDEGALWRVDTLFDGAQLEKVKEELGI